MATWVQDRRGTLLERGEALDRLLRGARDAARGDGSLLVLHGPAGLGKTRLLEELAAADATNGLRVLTARGLQLERDFGFGVVRQLLEPLIAAATPDERRRWFAGAAAPAAGLFGGDPGPADPTGFAQLNGLWWLLSAIAAREKLALLVDDAHWADDRSVRWLAFLGPRIAELRVLVVVAGRPGEPDAAPDWDALSTSAATTIELAPLTPEAGGRLLAEWLGAEPDDAFVGACHNVTGGNPFLLTELARTLVAQGTSPTAAHAAAVSDAAPDAVARSVVARLTAAGPEAEALARAVAVLGDGVPLNHADELADLDAAAATTAVQRLVDIGILRRSERLRFEHPLVRGAVYESIVPVVRGTMHRRAADILERRGADIEHRAAHLLASEPGGEQAVVVTLRRAATVALGRGARPSAADYLARALAEPPDPEVRADVLADLGWSEFQCGRPDAERHLREVIALDAAPEPRARAAHSLVTLLLAHGDIDSAVALADERHGGRRDAHDLAVETELLCAGMTAGASVWAKLSPRLRSLADTAWTAGDEGRPLLALMASDQLRTGGSWAEMLRCARAALEDDVLLERGASYSPFLHATYCLARGGDYALALDVLDRAVVQSRERGSLLGFGFAACTRGIALGYSGRLDAAEAELRLAVDAAQDNGWTLLEWHAIGYLLRIMAERNELDEGERILTESGYSGDLPDHLLTTGLRGSRAWLRFAQGRWREAYEDFMAVGRQEAPFTERSQANSWRSEAVIALARLGEHDEALSLGDLGVRVAREWGDPLELAQALHARGVAKGEDGIDDLRASIDDFPAGRYEGMLAAALVDYGALLRRTGHRADAREPLRRALVISERIGAGRYAEAARTELAATGARARSVVRTGVDSLTPSELRIARLAAGGLSNPEIAQQLFVTRKTVETHLSHVFMKLDIASRGELPAVLGL